MTITLQPLEVASTRYGPVRVFVATNGATEASLQIQTSYDIAGAWVVSFKRSNDGANAYDFAAGAVTLNAAGMTAKQDVSGFAFVCVEVSTNGTTGTVIPTVELASQYR